ncbi:MAG: molybdopterin-binding protein [Myxococcales bacterium]
MKTRGYLRTTPLVDAQERLLARLVGTLPAESVATEDALGRVTAAPVFARASSPHFHAAAMDGIAVRAEATRAASEAHPLRLRRGEGYEVVDTGDPLPERFDAVVMIEEVHECGPDEVEILKAAAPRQHVRLVGEDVVKGELIFPRGHRLRPFDLSALLGCGNLEVPVARRPLVGILPTGDEVVEPGAPLEPGAIVDTNSRMLAAVVQEEGGLARRYPVCPDDEGALEQAARRIVAECDVALVIAGSSAGRGDFTARVLDRVG